MPASTWDVIQSQPGEHETEISPVAVFKSSDTSNPHERPFTGMPGRHPRSASGRGRCSISRLSLGGPPFPVLA